MFEIVVGHDERIVCRFTSASVLRSSQPIAVERAWLVDALVGVGAEVIALGLQQVGRQPVLAVAVVIGKRRAKAGTGMPSCDGRRDHVPPGGCAFSTARVKYGASSRFSKLRVGVERFLDAIQKRGPNDAAAAPQQRDLAVVQRPVVLLGRRFHLHEALGVAANLRGVQGLAHCFDELRRDRP